MRCRAVRNHLVALQDDELSPGEATQVREHLQRCTDCRRAEQGLAAATPRDDLAVPPQVLARLHARVEGPRLRQLARERPPERASWWQTLTRWLGRDAEVPLGALLAYAALLVAALGWGVANWWTVEDLQERLAAQEEPAAPRPRIASPLAIPAEQYRPAAWVPEEDSGYH